MIPVRLMFWLGIEEVRVFILSVTLSKLKNKKSLQVFFFAISYMALFALLAWQKAGMQFLSHTHIRRILLLNVLLFLVNVCAEGGRKCP